VQNASNTASKDKKNQLRNNNFLAHQEKLFIFVQKYVTTFPIPKTPEEILLIRSSN
jgi:hypothetical protein